MIHPRRSFCHKPFTTLSVHGQGVARVCCHDWLPTSIGNLESQPPPEVWNSKTAQAVRESILDGSFRYCKAHVCPDLVAGTLPTQAQVTDPFLIHVISRKLVKLARGPRHLALSYDTSCNLKCPTCRTHLIMANSAEVQRMRSVQRRLLDECLPGASELFMSGFGDPLASRVCRELLRSMDCRDYPGLTIHLMTNGLLLGPAMWKSMARITPAIRSVHISIDAATPETYRRNRGGNFEKLMGNLEFLQAVRRETGAPLLEISFVVQDNNYREMEAFVRLGQRFGAIRVLFQRLIRWQAMTVADFHAAAVHEPAHPNFEEFQSVLSSTVFVDEIVDFSNLSNLRIAAAPSRH